MPSPITTLNATVDTQRLRATLDWQNPAGTLTGTKIESSEDGATWTVEWDGALLTTRNVYPRPLVQTAYRVSAKDGGGYSTPVYKYGVLLEGQSVHGFVFSLVDADDPTQYVAFGTIDNPDTLGWTTDRRVTELEPMGQANSDYFYSKRKAFLADQMDPMFPSYTLEDGSRQLAAASVSTLVTMELSGHRLLYRDPDRKLYCRIFTTRPRPWGNVHRRCSFTLKTTKPPAFPLTS